MGLFSSKTKYYVSSSTFPMFDDSSRVNQYAAAMLDYTANSPIEHSEYIKSFYNTSRLRNYRGYLNWCEKNGFYDTFGKVNANFYSDAKLDNTVVGNAIKHLLTIGENDTFGVYRSKLSFFSEDFYIKYLATQQGLADKFYDDGDLYYTISYPTNYTIRATLKDGTYVEGPLPTGSSNTRFIEISYSIIREVKEEYYPPEETPPEEEGTLENKEPVIITNYITEYGFYHYQEGSGNSVLDDLIKNNNGISVSNSFFPPIPLRSNTAWFTGNKANKINEALKYLEIRKTNSDRETGYDQLKEACSKMEKGSINDIDYITILLGVHLNSDNNSDQKYIFEFFYNLYFNYALKAARPNPNIAKVLYSGSNYIGEFASYAKRGFASSGYSDGHFTKFTINCDASNLNLTYSWGHADYFEQNGQWKPNAKIGDYGVLSGAFSYSYSREVEVWHPGNNGEDDGYYETEIRNYTVPYTLTAFCHQTSKNRFRFTLFTSLSLINLIYHGKTIETFAQDAINAASGKENVTLSFVEDIGKDNTEYSKITLKRVTVTGEIDTPFIVPLEHNTFHEIGVKNQADIAPCSMFLIYNCWVKVKQKWYQRGFFKWIALAVAVVIAVFTYGSTSWLVTAVFYAAVATAIVIAVSIALDLLTKVLTAILGDRIGGMIGGLLQSIFNFCCAFLVNFFGFWSPIGIGIMIGMSVNNADAAMQNGASFGEGLLKGFGKTAVSVGAYEAGIGIGGDLGTVAYVGLETLGHSFIDSGSFTASIKQAGISMVATAVTMGVMKGSNTLFGTSFTTNIEGMLGKNGTYTGEITKEVVIDAVTKSLLQSTTAILKNPNTYASLLNAAMDEYFQHKLKNIRNDYQEFTNNLQATQDALDVLNACMSTTATAEFVALIQSNIGRLLDVMPETYLTMTPDQFLSVSLASGSDMIKQTLGGITTFADTKLSLNGYSPSTLYYTQTDPTLLWDVT